MANKLTLDDILQWHTACREEVKAAMPGYADPKWAEERYREIVNRHRDGAKQAILQWIASEVVGSQNKKEYWPVWKQELLERQRQILKAHGWKEN